MCISETLLQEFYLKLIKATLFSMIKNIFLSFSDSSPVSLTLPKRKEEYTSIFLFSFFDGLIPEGWLLNIVTQNWKIDKKDRFGILLVACHDPIGNVNIREVRQ